MELYIIGTIFKRDHPYKCNRGLIESFFSHDDSELQIYLNNSSFLLHYQAADTTNQYREVSRHQSSNMNSIIGTNILKIRKSKEGDFIDEIIDVKQLTGKAVAEYHRLITSSDFRVFIIDDSGGLIKSIDPKKVSESPANAEKKESQESVSVKDIEKSSGLNIFLQEGLQKKYKNIILYGPPGTGKTFKTRELSQNIVGPNSYDEYSSKHQIVFTTFHQSLGYEDFIEGIKPEVDGNNGVTYKVIDGLFKKICIAATASCLNLNNVTFQNGNYSNLFSDIGQYNSLKDLVLEKLRKNFIDVNQSFKSGIPESGHDYKFVVIIDEINRGNISQIFGELITLIEEDKRGGQNNELRAILPYSREPFIVPPNVYIIGTMNTADRSAEALDTALRRRFVFIEMPPVYNDLSNVLIENVNNIDGDNASLGDLLKIINDRIFVLKGKDYEIGHSYFLEIAQDPNQNGNLRASVSIQEVNQVIIYKILPLLQEYFYNDFEKIMHVLSDHYSCNPFGVEIRWIDDGFTGLHNISTETDFYEVIRPDQNSIQRAIQRIFDR